MMMCLRLDLLSKKGEINENVLERILRALKLASSHHAKDMRQRTVRERLDSLTVREKDVLRGLIEGKPSKVISTERSIGVKTVDVHRVSIKEKLGAVSIATLVRDMLQVWNPSDEQAE
jgi:FixJ family two-component response regulator